MSAARRPPSAVRLCLGVVECAAFLVPAPGRAEWRREWSAEVRGRWAELEARGEWTGASAARLALRCLGSLADAVDARAGGLDLWVEDAAGVAARWTGRALASIAALCCLALGTAIPAAVFALEARFLGHEIAGTWAALDGRARSVFLSLAAACGVGLLVAGAVAAERLLRGEEPVRASRRLLTLEAGLASLAVAPLSAALARFAALGFAVRAPGAAPASATGPIGTGWLLAWIGAAFVLGVLHRHAPSRRR